MKFEHEKTWECLKTILASKLTAKDAWSQLIDFHEQIAEKPYWTALRQLDIDKEQNDMLGWLHRLVTASPVPKNVNALWVNFYQLDVTEFGLENSNSMVPFIEIVGTDQYRNEDIEWTENPIYSPCDAQPQPPLLLEIENIIRTDPDNYEFLNWILPLAYMAFTLDEIIRKRLKKKHFLVGKDKLFVAVGYSSKDYIEISIIE